MMKKTDYNVTNKLEDLDQLTRTIEKVHGKNHPELREVRQLFLAIQANVQEAMLDKKTLALQLERLRTITANYTPPEDGCQGYQKTYRLLKEMDFAYHG